MLGLVQLQNMAEASSDEQADPREVVLKQSIRGNRRAVEEGARTRMLRTECGKSRPKTLGRIRGGRDFLAKDGATLVMDEDIGERPANIDANGWSHLRTEHVYRAVPCGLAARERTSWESLCALIGKARHHLVGEQVKRTEHLFAFVNPLLDKEKTLFDGEFLAGCFNTARNRIRVTNQ